MSLAGWSSDQILKLTIDHIKIDGDLENFPVLITLSSGTGQTGFDATAVFDELYDTTTSGSYVNRKKIAATTTVSGIETELYVEIERWDHGNEQAYLWTKVPTIVSGTNTELYLYYNKNHIDNTIYVGDTGDSAAQNVWDNNFKGVWHMSQDPSGGSNCIKDSTLNANHGTPGGSMTSADLVDSKIGKGIDFDGGSTDDDEIDLGIDKFSSVQGTLEAIVKFSGTTTKTIFSTSNVASNEDWLKFDKRFDQRLRIDFKADGSYQVVETDDAYNVDTFYGFVFISTGSAYFIYSNGISQNISTLVGVNNGDWYADLDPITFNNWIGCWERSTSQRTFNGIIDEVRLSDTARTAEWLKATYYSNWDDLISFEEYSAVSFVFADPIPIHLSTVYGTTQQLQLTVTVSGGEPSYVYDAVFYDVFNDNQIGTTISGVESGQYVTTVMPTLSGIDYSWYLTATSSGFGEISSTYTFTNKFLCEGTTIVGGTLIGGLPIRLYRRNTGELIGSAVSTSSGTFEIESTFNENHYAVALYFDDETNALVYDWISP